MATIVEEIVEPSLSNEVSDIAEWIEAKKNEIETLIENQRWELVPKPKEMRPMSWRWAYKIK